MLDSFLAGFLRSLSDSVFGLLTPAGLSDRLTVGLFGLDRLHQGRFTFLNGNPCRLLSSGALLNSAFDVLKPSALTSAPLAAIRGENLRQQAFLCGQQVPEGLLGRRGFTLDSLVLFLN